MRKRSAASTVFTIIITLVIAAAIIVGVLFMTNNRGGKVSTKTSSSSSTVTTTKKVTTTAKAEETYKCGIYSTANSKRSLVTDTYRCTWTAKKDIASFAGIASQETQQDGKMGDVWKNTWPDIDGTKGLKTGYELYITLTDGTVLTEVMKNPDATTGDWNKYIEVWLYDDYVHSGGGWYSHLTDADFSDSSYIPSIKLTAGDSIADVSALKLTLFIYGPDSTFSDKTGEYLGSNKYSIDITRTNT